MNKEFQPSAVIIPAAVVIFNILIIVFPSEVVSAASDGVTLWFSGALPSLLPFIIGTHLLSALGVTRFFGRMLNPVMRRLFRVSGNGGYVLAAGFLSGYPMGAMTASSLRASGELSQSDANRLVCFTNCSGPLFILGTFAAGMLENVEAGYFLLLIHYLSAIACGILFSRILNKDKGKNTKKSSVDPAPPPANFGTVLSKAVTNGMETILLIGGFIILFSVVVKILEITHVFDFLLALATPFLSRFGISNDALRAVLTGLIELTNGMRLLSETGITKGTLVAASALLAFGGFSIHAQSISFIGKTDISTPIYLLAKLVQTGLSVILSLLLLPFFYEHIINGTTSFPVFKLLPSYTSGILYRLAYSSVFYILLCVFVGVLSVAAACLRYASYPSTHYRRHRKRREKRRRYY